MKLVYWKCETKRDDGAYSIRAKTKKEAKRLRKEKGEADFEEPIKIQVVYADAFDLVCQLRGEAMGGF